MSSFGCSAGDLREWQSGDPDTAITQVLNPASAADLKQYEC